MDQGTLLLALVAAAVAVVIFAGLTAVVRALLILLAGVVVAAFASLTAEAFVLLELLTLVATCTALLRTALVAVLASPVLHGYLLRPPIDQFVTGVGCSPGHVMWWQIRGR